MSDETRRGNEERVETERLDADPESWGAKVVLLAEWCGRGEVEEEGGVGCSSTRSFASPSIAGESAFGDCKQVAWGEGGVYGDGEGEGDLGARHNGRGESIALKSLHNCTTRALMWTGRSDVR